MIGYPQGVGWLLKNSSWIGDPTLAESRWEMARVQNASSNNWTAIGGGGGGGELRNAKDIYNATSIILTAIPVGVIIFIIIFGNILVIVAVLRDSQLKKQAQNWLIVSLASADLLVGLLIMPLTLTNTLLGQWTLGSVLCELWLALDVLFVTASILNLCAISLDRYWSLTVPTSYPQARTPRRMFIMILVVWLSAFAISFPPLVGWRPEGRNANECVLSDRLGYVIYSAFGSFYIPVSVLLFVYARIYFISRKRKRKSTAAKRKSSTEIRRLSLVHRLRQCLFKRRTKPANLNSNQKVSGSMVRNSTGSRDDLINCGLSNGGSLHSAHSNDYAAVIARVRALATLKGDDSTDDGYRKMAAAAAAMMPESDAISGNETSSGDGLSHVVAIAFAAATQSRQENSDSLISKSYQLQSQLRQRRKLVRRRERQATIVLGLVLGSFVISWLPFFCSYLLSAFCCKTPPILFDVIFWLGYCNSGFNPFIYNFFNRDFRRAFRRILCNKVIGRFSIPSFVSNGATERQTRRARDSKPILENGNNRRVLILRRRLSSLDNEN